MTLQAARGFEKAGKDFAHKRAWGMAPEEETPTDFAELLKAEKEAADQLAIDKALAEKIQAEMRLQAMAALSEEQMIQQAIAESLKEVEKQPLASECLKVSFI